ncbi:MAG: ribonuclease P protein component [Candidatus Komeilibacteria bacterium]|nr:ribonuclease P protein component [Candidatus Komeilibacteria bacterium]
MLSKANRVAKDAEFKLLARSGRPFYSPLFTFKVLKTAEPQIRFGVVISAKVSKKATQRNLAKRRITEIIRLSLTKIKPGFMVMILVKPAILTKTYREIKAEMEFLLAKAGLWQ